MKIKIWTFPFECYKCHHTFNAVNPEDIVLSYVGTDLSEKDYTRVRKIGEQWVNVCPQCGEFQGEFYVMDRCLEARNEASLDNYIVDVIEKELPCDICGQTCSDLEAVDANTLMCRSCYEKEVELPRKKRKDQ